MTQMAAIRAPRRGQVAWKGRGKKAPALTRLKIAAQRPQQASRHRFELIREERV
jgi:hypothetical protein